MAKKVIKRGRACKEKRGPKRRTSAAVVPSPGKTKVGGTGSGSGSADPGPGVEPCLFPCPSLRRVSNESLPRMCALLECKDEEAVLGGEDLDALQLELETLLSSVVVRLTQLNDQITVLNSVETAPQGRGRKQRKARAVIPTPIALPQPPPTEDKPTICRPPVKIPIKKLGNVPPPAPSPSSSQSPSKRSKMLRKRPDVASKTKPRGGKKQVEKDFVSHKFWNALDPYCCNVTEDTFNILSDILYQNQTEIPFLFNIPPLGDHFSKEWEIRDFVENQGRGRGNTSPPVSSLQTSSSPLSSSSTPSSESIGSAIRRKFRECSMALKRTLCTSIEKAPPSVSPPPTPATSKLMAALLGELPPPIVPLQESKDHNVIVKVEKEDDDKFPFKSSRPNSASSSSTVFEIPRKHQRKCLDRKFRLDKEAQGEIETSVRHVTPPQSLLEELKRTQAEFKLVVDHNCRLLGNLTHVIADELKLQNLKRKLQEVDDNVIDIYHTRTAAKLAKQSISDEDVAQAWKALKERDLIIRQINLFEHRWNKVFSSM